MPMDVAEWLDETAAALAAGDSTAGLLSFAKLHDALVSEPGSNATALHRAIEAGAPESRGALRNLIGSILGTTFLNLDRLDAAEFYLEDDNARTGKKRPFDALAYARSLHVLGKVYGRQLRLAYAVECANRTIAQLETLPEGDPTMLAEAHCQAGALMRECGQWEPARQHLVASLDALAAAAARGENQMDYFYAIMGALQAYLKLGMPDPVEHMLKVIPGMAAVGDETSEQARYPAFVIDALLKHGRGDIEGSRASAQRAVNAIVGHHELWQPLSRDLVPLLLDLGNPAAALQVLSATMATDDEIALRLLDTSHFVQRVVYSDALAASTDSLLRLVLERFPGDTSAARLALGVVLKRKGLLTGADLDDRRLADPAEDAAWQAARSQVEALREQVRARELEGASDGHRKMWDEIATLKRKQHVAENSLAGWHSVARRPRVADLSTVAAALGDDEALIEFIAMRPPLARDPLVPESADHVPEVACERYVGFVLTSDGETRLLDLGDAASLEALVYSYVACVSPWGKRELTREQLAARVAGDESVLGKLLRARVFDPVAALLPAGVKRLRIAPDGALAAVAFATLPVEDEGEDQRLIDRFEISYLTCGRMLLREPAAAALRAPLIFANPDYDGGVTLPPRESQDPPAFWFTALPNSATEAIRVQKRIGGDTVSGAAASRAALAAAAAPAILHVATHGYFLPHYSRGLNVIGQWRREGMGTEVRGDVIAFSDEPLLRSGLACAGVNAWSSGRETDAQRGDGLLLAQDVARLDLRGTRLVFLSACSTARGTVRPGEGCAGLLQGIQAAGARAVIAAFWATADHPATVNLVDRFYSRLVAGDTVPAALRLAQRELRRLGVPLWVWGAFGAHGDPRVTWKPDATGL